MADFVSPILNVVSCLWNSTAKRATYVRNLKENLTALGNAMDQLKRVYDDTIERVLREESLNMKRTNEVAGWLRDVESMEADVKKILLEGKEYSQQKCLEAACCPQHWLPIYKLGKTACNKIKEIDKLRTEGNFNALAVRVQDSANERPMERTMGLESIHQEVWRCIEDTNSGIIGLYGIRGVGKTTLLRQLYSNFLQRNQEFRPVIWVSAFKEAGEETIQEVILRELGIPDDRWNLMDTEGKASIIFKILKGKKFVLLVDDIQGCLDLRAVGIPPPDVQNQSKVIFTTPSEGVCGLIEAQQSIRVGCLTPEAALDLFRQKVGEHTLNCHPDIPELAKAMAERCEGLPLALVSVGRAMATRKTLAEWEYAIQVLRNSASQFPGMTEILSLLKFGFDALPNDTLKSCFLYCCIFPSEYNISKKELIEHWIGDGLLDESTSIYVSKTICASAIHKKGEHIIGSLKQACLLESGESEDFVRMHDLIREMALLEYSEKIMIYVKRKAFSFERHGLEHWDEKERMSVWVHSIDNLFVSFQPLPNLRTLLLRVPTLSAFPTEFLPHMPSLTVLDLSCCFSLSNLLDEIGKLINLQYLNLSHTAILHLPMVLQNLRKLRCFLVDCTRFLKLIPSEVIPNFQLLEVFSKSLVEDLVGQSFDEDLLKWLCSLQYLREICIAIKDAIPMTIFLDSQKLQMCTRKLSILELPSDFLSLKIIPSFLGQLEHLELIACSGLVGVEIKGFGDRFRTLRHVLIKDCPFVRVTWLTCALALQTLALVHCTSMKEVIEDIPGTSGAGGHLNCFSRLTVLRLECLPQLTSISKCVLPFPSLQKIDVTECPNLKKLPFDSNSARNSLMQIKGERNWWEGLQWDDEDTKQVFGSKFVESPH